MTSIALYVNQSRPRALETARKVAGLAREAKLKVAVCENDGPGGGLGFVPTCEVEEADLLITIGGDGTLLRGARLAHPRGMLILGVNTGRLGFLTEVEADPAGFAALRAVFQGDYQVEHRVALHAQVNGEQELHFALNDVVVRRGAQARMAPFGLTLDGENVAHLPSDGVIVSTPTGSTGYFLSAGGPIIHPSVDALGVAALLPHTLFARPLIVPSDATIEITCDGEIARANLEADGNIAGELRAGDTVTIRRTEHPVRFARVSDGAFFKRLENKLQWGVPIKT
ncbi:MAG: kinase [Candidatus Eremiobacteraeota bacterium]|nr:kinase [Candidatus Eremiobacteraeota bacterium]